MDNTSKTLIKGLRLLEVVASTDQPSSTIEISKEIGLSRTTTYRLLSTLESSGYVNRDKNGKYSLGLAVNNLLKKRSNRLGLIEAAETLLHELCEETGETAVLAQLMNNEIMDIAKVESPRSVRIHAKIGSLNPAHCTATGKAILAFLSEVEIKELYPTPELITCTENSIQDLRTLQNELEIIKTQGYAVEENEYEIGMKCIAAPIFYKKTKIIAAIGIAGMAFRVDHQRTPEIIKSVVDKAIKVSAKLE